MKSIDDVLSDATHSFLAKFFQSKTQSPVQSYCNFQPNRAFVTIEICAELMVNKLQTLFLFSILLIPLNPIIVSQMHQLSTHKLSLYNSCIPSKGLTKQLPQSRLRQNIARKSQLLKTKYFPYQQKLLTARQALKHRSNKKLNLVNSDTLQQANDQVLRASNPQHLCQTNAVSRNLMQATNLNLFKQPILTSRLQFRRLEGQKQTFVRSRSYSELNKRQPFTERITPKRITVGRLANGSEKAFQLSAQKRIKPGSAKVQKSAFVQYRKVGKIFIFQKGIVMKNEK